MKPAKMKERFNLAREQELKMPRETQGGPIYVAIDVDTIMFKHRLSSSKLRVLLSRIGKGLFATEELQPDFLTMALSIFHGGANVCLFFNETDVSPAILKKVAEFHRIPFRGVYVLSDAQYMRDLLSQGLMTYFVTDNPELRAAVGHKWAMDKKTFYSEVGL